MKGVLEEMLAGIIKDLSQTSRRYKSSIVEVLVFNAVILSRVFLGIN